MKHLLQWAFTSSALILIVLAVRALFRDRLSARLRYALWGVVLLRLLVPFQVELPAPVSDSVPLLVSNAVPEVGQWGERTIPVFPERSKPVAEFNLDMEATLEPGGILSYSDKTGCQQRSADGETIIWYRYLLSPEQIVLALWLAGAGLTGAVILLSNLRFGLGLRKRRRPLEVPDAPVPVYVAEGLPSPCLFGVFRPAVYVTPQAAANPDTLRHVLAHELTHYAHLDHLWSLLRCFSLALHWYNPLVWLAVGLSKGDGELACDEGAVARLGEAERIPYGRTLVDMVAARSLRPGDLLSCSTAMTGGEKSTKRRVTQIVKKTETVKIALFAAAALVALGLVFVFVGRAQPKVNTMFRDQLDLAASIRYSPPLISSQTYPDPISDPDLLAAAKEALSGFTYLDSGDPGPNLQKGLISTSRMVLINDSAETPYTLLWQDGCSYLFPGDMWEEELKLQAEYGEGAHIQGVSGTMQAKPGSNVGSVLESLARRQRSRLEEDPDTDAKDPASLYVVPNKEPERVHPVIGPKEQPSLLGDLTQEQVDRANEAFAEFVEVSPGGYASSEISCFFTSNYDDPTQIDLEEFLRYCPIGTRDCLGEEDTEEFLAVMAQDNIWVDPERELHSPYDLPVPVHRYPRAEVSALLQKYAGVTVEKLDWDGCLYVEKYDAFYNFTSDAGPGVFPCAGGQIMEDSVLLWSEPDENGDRCELVLRKDGDRWLIQSHHTIYER